MNTLTFVIRRTLRSFGVVNERNHLHIASQQAQYLSEAEDILGRIAWKDVGDVPELSEEYWKLKEIETEEEQLKKDIAGIEATNAKLTSERDRMELRSENELADLTKRKTEAMRRAIAQMHDVETSRGTAELTKKKYSGLRIKLKVLTEEGASAGEIAEVQTQMDALKAEYASDKRAIEALTGEIRETEAGVAKFEEKIEALRTEARTQMTEMMNRVSRSSKLVAENTARVGAHETTKRELAAKVGAFLAANYKNADPDLKPVVRKYRNILNKIQSLRTSIQRHRLIGGRDTIEV